MGMFGNAAAAFGGAGDPQAAAAMLAQLRPLLLQQQQDAQDAKLREIMTSHGDLSNEDNRRNAQSALTWASQEKKGRQSADIDWWMRGSALPVHEAA